MPQQIAQFTLTDAQRIAKMLRWFEREHKNAKRPPAHRGGRGGTTIAVARLTATLSAGGNAAATYVVGGTGSVTNGVNDVLLCGGDTLASGTTVIIAQISGKQYVIDANCPCD